MGSQKWRLSMTRSLRHSCCFFLNEHPVVTLARPPVGWHKTMLHPTQRTTVCAWLKTVVILTQLGHLTSMKNEFGLWTNLLSLHFLFSSSIEGFNKSLASGIFYQNFFFAYKLRKDRVSHVICVDSTA